MASRGPPPSSSASGSVTVTIDPSPSSSSSSAPAAAPPPPETVVLRLKRRAKKKVSWKEGTVDNESLGRKSSKKCCIFHKEVPFDEDCSDDEPDPGRRNPPGDGGEGTSGGCSSHGHRHHQH
ncbi:protein phosphatase 1 regulatory subunit INH3-like [Lolium rigidum]|uniref:protein phosphatase 1 regulatory subunit INH3-like n=1 Tax=Lolium rigidum TaxID=89674 RepID=UPI001F5DA118|nr:protein phosphatase 1 regulatory subunit INH3-like [Lolium rigidum]